MENSIVKSVNSGLTKIWQVSLLFILFNVSFVNGAVGQNDEPSVQNLKNNLAAAAEKEKHDEFMSYLYMAFWFAIVIGIAWSTTVMARKRNKRQLEEKQRYILKQQELKKHHHHGHAGHAAHGHVKARR